jgi:hypothetical protein
MTVAPLFMDFQNHWNSSPAESVEVEKSVSEIREQI